MMKKSSFKKHLIEGLLIIFSVLFALFIDKYYDNKKIEERKDFAIKSIKKEIYRNSAIIKVWKKSHLEMSERINQIVDGKNDSLKNELIKHKFINLGVLTNNGSFINSLPTKTAWETSKSTGIISEFNFDTTQQLTNVYSLQEILTERTLMGLLDLYFEEAHNIDNIDAILIQFRLRFGELLGQEYKLDELYVEAIKRLE
jgi:hypothetical protein